MTATAPPWPFRNPWPAAARRSQPKTARMNTAKAARLPQGIILRRGGRYSLARIRFDVTNRRGQADDSPAGPRSGGKAGQQSSPPGSSLPSAHGAGGGSVTRAELAGGKRLLSTDQSRDPR